MLNSSTHPTTQYRKSSWTDCATHIRLTQQLQPTTTTRQKKSQIDFREVFAEQTGRVGLQ